MNDNVQRIKFKTGISLFFLILTVPILSQSFTQETGSNNPMNGEDVGDYSALAFIDIDNDGDWDAFAGESDGTLHYFENTGSASAPSFTERTGASNPMDGWDVGSDSTPAFVDLDADGDYDLYVGSWSGWFYYFENTGNASSASFTYRSGANDPLWVYDAGTASVPRFIDIDDDGDWDMLSGIRNGQFKYYENIGTSNLAVFLERTGGLNPMNGMDVGRYSSHAYIDIDEDGDFDLISGEEFGTFLYYENTGTRSAPTFVNRTGAYNPLNGVDIGFYSTPNFVDLDDDGDGDLMSGESSGTFLFYTGSSTGGNPLPVELITFTADLAGQNTVSIKWETASEVNNSHFVIEKSNDAQDWLPWREIQGAGNSNSILRYEEVDFYPYEGHSYYRLVQVDFDGTETTYDPVAVFIESASGIISLYPNPSEGMVTFQIDGSADIDRIEIFDFTGKMVFEESVVSGMSVWRKELNSIPPGSYLILAQTSNGGVYQERLVLK